MNISLFFLVLSIFILSFTFAKKSDHLFSKGEVVPLYVTKIGPYSNPSESYSFYSLPFCRPEEGIKKIKRDLGEKLEGDLPQTTPFKVKFKEDQKNEKLCGEIKLGKKELKRLRKAISKYYYYEFELDGIPIRGFIGTVDPNPLSQTKRFFLFTHYHFNILYNDAEGPEGKGAVIYANITSVYDNILEIIPGQETLSVQFTYSTNWYKTNKPFDNRLEYWHDNFFKTSPGELEIHWLSILNSFVLVILLTSFLAIIIMRILKSDITRYEEEDEGEEDDYGWKLLHRDVFRFPPFKNLFCAFIGVGAQFMLMVFFILVLALIGLYYPGNEGNLAVSAIVLYALTAAAAGFTSTRFYTQMGGKSWAWNVMLTATVYAVPFCLIAFVLNIIAVSWNVTQALPVGTILWIIFIWLCVGFPLTLVGGVAGKRLAGEFYSPVRTKNFPREIPSIPWYRTLPIQMLMAGFLPFSAIYIELFYIYNSVWGRSSYQLWGILCLVFIILLIVTACITVALTYFQLSMEDYRWWWSSFLSGGSTGLFIYAYSVFYYVFRSNMYGFLQAAFYFGYMSVACYFFFLMLGTVGFYSSLVFVRQIFKNLHFD